MSRHRIRRNRAGARRTAGSRLTVSPPAAAPPDAPSAASPDTLIQRGEYEAAIAALRVRLAAQPSDGDRLTLAWCRWRLGDPEGALADTDDVIGAERGLARRRDSLRAWLLLELDRYTEARACFECLQADAPDGWDRYGLARAIATGREDRDLPLAERAGVIAALEPALDGQDCPHEVVVWLADLVDPGWQRHDARAAVLRRGIAARPRDDHLRWKLVSLVFRDDGEEAATVLAPPLARGAEWAAWWDGRLAQARGAPAEALAQFDRMSASVGPAVPLQRGRTLLALGQPGQARAAFEALATHPEPVSAIIGAFGMARCAHATGNAEALRSTLATALARWRTWWEEERWADWPNLRLAASFDEGEDWVFDAEEIDAFAGRLVAEAATWGLDDELADGLAAIRFIRRDYMGDSAEEEADSRERLLAAIYAAGRRVWPRLRLEVACEIGIHLPAEIGAAVALWVETALAAAVAGDERTLERAVRCVPWVYEPEGEDQGAPLPAGPRLAAWRAAIDRLRAARERPDLVRRLGVLLYGKGLADLLDAGGCIAELRALAILLVEAGADDERIRRDAARTVSGSKAVSPAVGHLTDDDVERERFRVSAPGRWRTLNYYQRRLLVTLDAVDGFDSFEELARLAGQEARFVPGHWRRLVELGMIIENGGRFEINPAIRALVEGERRPEVAVRIVRASGDRAVKPIFNSQQEVEVYRLVAELFPAAIVFPNVALSALFIIDALRERLERDDINFLLRSHVDLCVLRLGDWLPVVAIEVDSEWHDAVEQQQRDARKDRIFGAAGLPLVRVRQHGPLATGELRSELVSALRRALPDFGGHGG